MNDNDSWYRDKQNTLADQVSSTLRLFFERNDRAKNRTGSRWDSDEGIYSLEHMQQIVLFSAYLS